MAPFSTDSASDISVDISPNLDEAIRKVIILPGEVENDRPLYKDYVTVEYSGFFESGECFTTKQKYSFYMGTGDVIQAWNIGVSTMCLGEVSLFHSTSDYAYGTMGLPPLIPPSTNLIFEIELVSFKGENLTKNKDEGILMSIISPGTSLDKPLYGATCKVDIVGWCLKDKEFLSLLGHEVTLDEQVGEKVIFSLERALKKSSLGQKSLVKIIPKYGYKRDSCKNFCKIENIFENSTQFFHITLLSINQARQHWDMTQEELLVCAKQLKEKGSDYFRKGRSEEASRKYKRGLFLLDAVHNSEDMKSRKEEIKLLCHINLSLCHLKLGNYLRAFNEADVALQMQSDNVKALYRRGLAHYHLSNYDEAIEDLMNVLKIEPKNRDAIFQLRACRDKMDKEKIKQRDIFSGMFNKFKEFDQKLEPSNGANGDVFCDIGEWNNKMAQGMLSLEQEMEAFKEDDDDDDVNIPINDDEDDEQFCV